MNEPNTLAPLEFSIQAKRRIFTSILDQSCAGMWHQKARNVLNRLDALDAELSDIERELDAVIKSSADKEGLNPESVRR